MFTRSSLRTGGAAVAFICFFACQLTMRAEARDSHAAGHLTVSKAWIRGMPLSIPSGGYFTLSNGTDKNMVLTGAASPACGMLMMHQSVNVGGREEMRAVSSLDVPAGGSVAFAPGGYHLMCMKAKPAIKPGATVPVTLMFKDGTKLTSNFPVRNALGK